MSVYTKNRPAKPPVNPARPFPQFSQRPPRRPDGQAGQKPGQKPDQKPGEKPRIEHPILFQDFFKSVGPRTYAIQFKKASNGNHYMVLIEGQRDPKSGELYKRKVNVFSEDFEAFWVLLGSAHKWIKANPVPEKVASKQKALWTKRNAQAQPQLPPQAKLPHANKSAAPTMAGATMAGAA